MKRVCPDCGFDTETCITCSHVRCDNCGWTPEMEQ